MWCEHSARSYKADLTFTPLAKSCTSLSGRPRKLRCPRVSILLFDLTTTISGLLGGDVIVKSVNHFRLQNERDVLVRFQSRTPHIRPLLDEVEPDSPFHALVMRWLDSDLLNVTRRRQLASSEVKLVARGVLEALQALHADGYVHTGQSL